MRIARMRPDGDGATAAVPAAPATPAAGTAAAPAPAAAPAAPAAGEATGRVIPGPGAGTKPPVPSLDELFAAVPKPIDLPADEGGEPAAPQTGTAVDQIVEAVLARLGQSRGQAPAKPTAPADGEGGAEVDPAIAAIDRLGSRIEERLSVYDNRLKEIEKAGGEISEERDLGRIFGQVRAASSRFSMDEATRQTVTHSVFREMARAKRGGERVTEREIIAAFNDRIAPIQRTLQATRARLEAERERGEGHALPPASGSAEADPDAVIEQTARELGLRTTKIEDMSRGEFARLEAKLRAGGIIP